jgi:hypothetical protein
MGAPTACGRLEAKRYTLPAPVTVAAYNQYGSYCQGQSSLKGRGAAPRSGGVEGHPPVLPASQASASRKLCQNNARLRPCDHRACPSTILRMVPLPFGEEHYCKVT